MIILLLYHTPTSVFSTLSLHDALPILLERLADQRRHVLGLLPCQDKAHGVIGGGGPIAQGDQGASRLVGDRKSTRLNSSHLVISYAVFCLKKKTQYDQLRASIE